MPRASREDMARNHERVLQQASRLVRERGLGGVSVPEVMATAGMTHGGFYKHFASKDVLLARAGEAAFAERQAALDERVASASDRARAREQFIADYLSIWHRDNPADGCASVALAADSAHRGERDSLHQVYISGLNEMAEALHALRQEDRDEQEAGDGTAPAGPDSGALADLATLVGAVLLARATTGDDISERILAAARDHLLKR